MWQMTHAGLVWTSWRTDTPGYSPRCPNCDRREGYYSCMVQGWVCGGCGLWGVGLKEWQT